jgi:hypothetical protein
MSFAVSDEQEPVVVKISGVAGVHPAAAQRQRREFGLAPIALHHDRPAHDDLSDFATRQFKHGFGV